MSCKEGVLFKKDPTELRKMKDIPSSSKNPEAKVE